MPRSGSSLAQLKLSDVSLNVSLGSDSYSLRFLQASSFIIFFINTLDWTPRLPVCPVLQAGTGIVPATADDVE